MPVQLADHIADAPLMGFGTSTLPTPNDTLGVDAWELDYLYAGSLKTAWAKFKLPDGWDPNVDLVRVNFKQTVIRTSNPLYVYGFWRIFTGGDPNHPGFFSVAQGGGNAYPDGTNLFDSETPLNPGDAIEPGAFWIVVGVYDVADDVAADYVLDLGRLVEGETTGPTIPAPPELPVRVSYYADFTPGMLNWDEPYETGTTTGVVRDLSNVSNYGVNRATDSPGVEWSFMPRFYLGENEADFPLPPGRPREMFEQVVQGTVTTHGQRYNDEPYGPAYPEGYWTGAGSPPGFTMLRQEWAQHGFLIENTMTSVVTARADMLKVREELGGFTTAMAPDFADTSYTGNTYWRPFRSGYSESGTTGYELLAQGHVTQGSIIVYTRNHPEQTNRVDTGDLILLGAMTLPADGEPMPTLAELVDNSVGLVATVVSPQVGYQWTRYVVPIPTGYLPWPAETDGIWVTVTPALVPAKTPPALLPGASGTTPPGDVWPERFAPNSKAFPDTSVESWAQSPQVELQFQYVYQPPPFRFTYYERSTEPGEDADEFVPAPPARLSGRSDGALVGARRLGTTSRSQRYGFRPGSPGSYY